MERQGDTYVHTQQRRADVFIPDARRGWTKGRRPARSVGVDATDLKADLAVLSACETARGRIGGGEGVIGLSWAMFIAGVPSTVVSHGKLNRRPRDLMVNFNRSVLSSRSIKSEALREAALKLMRSPETSHPFYWAGFVLVGDGQ
jgi:CHAT domain-containing protein